VFYKDRHKKCLSFSQISHYLQGCVFSLLIVNHGFCTKWACTCVPSPIDPYRSTERQMYPSTTHITLSPFLNNNMWLLGVVWTIPFAHNAFLLICLICSGVVTVLVDDHWLLCLQQGRWTWL